METAFSLPSCIWAKTKERESEEVVWIKKSLVSYMRKKEGLIA